MRKTVQIVVSILFASVCLFGQQSPQPHIMSGQLPSPLEARPLTAEGEIAYAHVKELLSKIKEKQQEIEALSKEINDANAVINDGELKAQNLKASDGWGFVWQSGQMARYSISKAEPEKEKQK